MRQWKHSRPRPRLLDPTLVDAIQHIPVPAFVVAGSGDLMAANEPGHAWLAARPTGAGALAGARGPDPERFWVTASLHGNRPYYLAVLREPEPPAPRITPPARWGLTPREREVAAWIVRGATNAQIANELRCSHRTVEHHVTSILRKANVLNRASLAGTLIASRT